MIIILKLLKKHLGEAILLVLQNLWFFLVNFIQFQNIITYLSNNYLLTFSHFVLQIHLESFYLVYIYILCFLINISVFWKFCYFSIINFDINISLNFMSIFITNLNNYFPVFFFFTLFQLAILITILFLYSRPRVYLTNKSKIMINNFLLFPTAFQTEQKRVGQNGNRQ